MSKRIMLGSALLLKASLKNADQVPVNTSVVVLYIRLPDETVLTVTVPEVVVVDVGEYEYTYAPTQVGTHKVKWQTSNSHAAVAEDSFFVVASTVI